MQDSNSNKWRFKVTIIRETTPFISTYKAENCQHWILMIRETTFKNNSMQHLKKKMLHMSMGRSITLKMQNCRMMKTNRKKEARKSYNQ